MSRLVLLLTVVALATPAAVAQTADASAPYAEAAARIRALALSDSAAYERIAAIADAHGSRLSGTAALEAAIDDILARMRADGLDRVRGQPAMVPVWVRGEESAALVGTGGETRLAILGLGGSVATPDGGLTAPVLVVSSFDDLAAHAADAAGRIVLFNVPFTTYGATVRYRVGGADAAARVGAVAALVRSVTPRSLSTPHTGTMRYAADVPATAAGAPARIPTAAVTVEAAERLQRMQDRGETPIVRLAMGARTEPDRLSRNVLAEVTGRERPNEIVVAGGHIDSWDVGQGAVDDLDGCVVAWEAVRVLSRLGLRPRRTVQVACWTNEENGTRGGQAFRDSLGSATANVQLALESDEGVFAPRGFGYTGAPGGLDLLRAAAEPLLRPVLESEPAGEIGIVAGGGGSDIEPLMDDGVPGLSLNTANEDYFLYHHTAADTVDKLNPRDLARAVAATAVLLYVAAEMPERLPHGAPAEVPGR
ncbi:MAG TPA: M20/M25/M40 family metallo-hydrolase [Rubricoccaceae bacterium]